MITRTLGEVLRENVSLADPAVRLDFATGRGAKHIDWRKYYAADEVAHETPHPLAGHRGDCAKVISAALYGRLETCDCGREPTPVRTPAGEPPQC